MHTSGGAWRRRPPASALDDARRRRLDKALRGLRVDGVLGGLVRRVRAVESEEEDELHRVVLRRAGREGYMTPETRHFES